MTKHLIHAVRIQKARTALLLDHPFSVRYSFVWVDWPRTRFRPWPRMASPCFTIRHLSIR